MKPSMIAAILATATDEELDKISNIWILVPEHFPVLLLIKEKLKRAELWD